MEPDSLQAPVREAMFTRYHELHAQAWEVRKRLAWKWPPLSDFACAEPARTVLAAMGVHPEWLSLFTWGEVCNWERYGMPNYQFLSPERLMRRALFGFKKGFELVRVASTLEDAMDRLVTEQVILAWSPEKPDVARNLTLDDAARRTLIEGEYENMWRRLQTVNTKNGIIEDLCRHYLSQSLSEAHRQVKAIGELPSHSFLMKWAARTGVSEEDLIAFIRNLALLNAADPTSLIPSLKLDRPPDLLTEETVEVLRERLNEATLRFEVLTRVQDALYHLLQVDGRPVDLAAYLADCVPLSVASKASTLAILRTLGISKKVNAVGFRIAEEAKLAPRQRFCLELS
jgi:hypothetical protein